MNILFIKLLDEGNLDTMKETFPIGRFLEGEMSVAWHRKRYES